MHHEALGPTEQELGGLRSRKTEKTGAEVPPEEWDKLLELTKKTKQLHGILEDLAGSGNHLPLWENLDIFPTQDDLTLMNQFFRYHKLPYRLDVNQDRVSVEEWENDKKLVLRLYVVE